MQYVFKFIAFGFEGIPLLAQSVCRFRSFGPPSKRHAVERHSQNARNPCAGDIIAICCSVLFVMVVFLFQICVYVMTSNEI